MNRQFSEFLNRTKTLKNHSILTREISGLFFPISISGNEKYVLSMRNLPKRSKEDYSACFKHIIFKMFSSLLQFDVQDCKIRLQHYESVFDHAKPICTSAIGFAFAQSVPTALQNTLQTRKAGFISAKRSSTVQSTLTTLQSLLQSCRGYCGGALFIHDQITLYS